MTIPVIGWIVIGFGLILLFIVLMTKNVRFKKGDIEAGIISKDVAKEVKTISATSKSDKKDDKTRMLLFRESNEIDERLSADLRRIVRSLDDEIFSIFEKYIKCEFPAVMLTNKIKAELFQRIEENNLRVKLSGTELNLYIKDIEDEIEKSYLLFTRRIEKVTCGENYPSWSDIESSLFLLLSSWADKSIHALVTRINEKIKLYEESANLFELEENRISSIDEPIKKNEKYIRNLEGEAYAGM